MAPASIFPNYIELRAKSWIPIWVWHLLRVISVIFAIGLAVILFVFPQIGLLLFWQLLIPILPLIFLIAPGVWRNVCPLAVLNQTPRLFSFTYNIILPSWLQEYGYIV